MFRRFASTVASVVIALAAVSACSLVVSTSGLAGGPAPDASVVSDAPTPMDASVDASQAPNDASTFVPPACASHLFCDDFDLGGVTRWDSTRLGAGSFDFDTMQFVSAPRSFRMNLVPGAGVRITQIQKSLVPVASAIRLELDLLNGGPSSRSFDEVDPLTLTIVPAPAGAKSHVLGIAMYPYRSTFEYHTELDGGGITNDEPEIHVPQGRWTHVVLSISYATSPAHATISFDGTLAGQVDLAGSSFTGVSLSIGAIYTQNANVTWTFDFDNLTVD